MPTNEKNNWDRANAQGDNQTDFNRNKPEQEYRAAKQEPADAHRNDTVNTLDEEKAEAETDGEKRTDFLLYGNTDEDLQF